MRPLRALFFLALCCSVRIISTGSEALVERLGKFDRRLSPGLNFIVPGLEGVSIRASVREQVLDVPPQPCITSDNAPLSADAVVFFRIRDLALARYAVDDFRACVTNLVLTQLRSEIGQLTLDQTFAARERLNQKLLEESPPCKSCVAVTPCITSDPDAPPAAAGSNV